MSDTKTDTAIVEPPKPKRYRHTQESISTGGFGSVGRKILQTRVIEVPSGGKVPKNAEPVPDDTPLSDWQTGDIPHPASLVPPSDVRIKE